MTTKISWRVVSLACLLSLGSCDGDGNNRNVPPPPATESVSAVGVITALGSVTVNGVVYQTDSTTVSLNGQAGGFSDLEVGQIVSLQGTIEVNAPRGTAASVDYEATLIGPVENIDAGLSRLTVMGQTVLTDINTEFGPGIDPLTFNGLTVGTTVQISGFRSAAGEVTATRIETDAISVGSQIIGSVTGLDLANSLFMIGGLTVDYGAAAVVNLPGGMPANGLFVVIRGSLAGGILTADSVDALYDVSGATPGERAQLQGVITRLASATDFDVNGFPVTTDAATTFTGGTATELQVNAEITVDGEIAASGDAVLANAINFGRVVGSTTTLEFDFSDFTEIDVRTVFNVAVTQGAQYRIEVTIDEEDADRVDVTKSDSTLTIGLLPASGEVNIQTLEAIVTLPLLNVIDLDGVINVTLDGFNQAQLVANVRGVSRLFSDSIMIGELTALVSGVSQLDFGNVRPMSATTIDVSGVSIATVNMGVGSSLTGTVTGVSSLNYYGTSVAVDVTVGEDSSLTKLGETRP